MCTSKADLSRFRDAYSKYKDKVSDVPDFNHQKPLSRDVLKKRCSENMQQINRRKPMPESDFNKAALQLY